jgi:predicted TIM-barrel fold metal-dependent hydrolase
MELDEFPTQEFRGASRRRFLASLGALAIGGAVPAGGVLAQAAAGGAKPNRIDVHHHIIPPPYVAAQRDRILAGADIPDPASILRWTPDRAVEEMDKTGVATAMTSISTPGIWFGDAEAARSLARACNEYAAQMGRDHAGRFGLFGCLPLPDLDGSLREIEYALDVLKADGIGMFTSYGDKWPGDPAFAPVFDELNRRKAVVYFHPTGAECCSNLMPGIPASAVEYLFDTTRAIVSLLYNGTFVRCPDIRFIFSHAGGTVTVLASRIDGFFGRHKEVADHVPHGAIAEMKKLHFDIASSVNPSTMAALLNLIPISQILFGSDYPYVPIPATAFAFDKFGLPAADMQAINRENALRLFPRLKT